MKTTSIGFIGGGRAVRILLEGWTRKGVMPGNIVVSDCNEQTLEKLKSRFTTIDTTHGDNAAAASQDVVFLAVHPPVMAEVVSALKGKLRPESILISLAPKFTVTKLGELLGGFSRIARVIPNGPSIVNAGFNPVFFGPALSSSDRAIVTNLLTPLGESPEVGESKLEAYAILSAMGPTYFWFQWQALREVATGFGLSETEAATALQHMISGAASTLLDSGLPPAQVMDLVPVKPLAEMESSVTELYKTRLPALFQKIKP
jgi:pyrroline-5-carboxylate reductase